jgi:hypothetical protein
VICLEILGLEYSKSSYNEYEECREYTRLRYSIDRIYGECLAESLLEHIESCEEDDEKSHPLDRWILHEEIGDIA